MDSQERAMKTLRLVLAVMVLMGMWALTMAAQDAASQQGTDNSGAAKPVLPASDDAKDVAKATPLPSTDTPASRVSSVRPDAYVVGVGDGLEINVWKEGELSRTVAVRPDGIITLPLIGEIKASGLTPVQLQDQITTALQKVVSDPQVTVIVVSVNSLSFNIMGNVLKPGFYPLTRPFTILDAIAISGGFRDFAKEKKIYVLRATAGHKQTKYFFNYKDVIKGRKMQQNIMLQPGDTLVVP